MSKPKQTFQKCYKHDYKLEDTALVIGKVLFLDGEPPTDVFQGKTAKVVSSLGKGIYSVAVVVYDSFGTPASVVVEAHQDSLMFLDKKRTTPRL